MKKHLILVTLMLAMVVMVVAACGSPDAQEPQQPDPVTTNDPVTSDEPAASGDGFVWEQDYTWKLTHEGAPGLGEDIFTRAFAELIHERSDGHITIEIYDFNQLGSSADQMELVQNGAVEFGLASAGAVASLAPEVSIFGLHYILPAETADLFDFLTDSDFVKLLDEIMLDYNFKVLCWSTEGPHVWTTNKEIRSLADMNGVKFRTQANQLEMASFNSYGANATTIPFAELYSALQLGTVDAQQQTALGNNLMNYYDVQKYYVQPHASYYIDAPVINRDLYESLPTEVQDMIVDCFFEARDVLEEYLATEDAVNAKETAVNEHGITWIEFDEATQAEFAEKSITVRDTYLSIGGPRAQEVLDTLIKDLGL